MFEYIWAKIKANEGVLFYTKTKLPFTYQIVNECVVPDRTNYPIAKTEFEKASKVEYLTGPGQINNLVRGPAYVYAILTDPRIK